MLADDPFGGRYPTSHERMTGLPWDASYHNGPPPWDIGQPQPAVVRLASEYRFAGSVLDAGCGTGENTLHIASLGLSVLGVDVAEVAFCGLFHTFDGDERSRYAASVASVTEPDGTLYVLCFSDEGPDTGPHPISQVELRAAFSLGNGWKVAAIERDRIQTRFHDDGAPAWFATIQHI